MIHLSRRVAAIFILCLALIAIPASAALAAPGDLDPTFDTDGSVFAQMSEASNRDVYTPRVTQAPDGSLIGAATSEVSCLRCEKRSTRSLGAELRVFRVSQAGAILDEATVPASGLPHILDLRVLADGTTVIVHRRFSEGLIITLLDADLAVINELSRDVYDVCDDDGELVDAAIRAGGTIAVAWTCGNDPYVELLDQELNTVEGFDSGVLDLSPISDLALSPSGTIFVLTSIEGEARVSRILPGGGVDMTYGVSGEATYMDGNVIAPGPAPSSARDAAMLAVDSLGRAVVALDTHAWRHWQHIRFTPDGALDAAGFGTEGLSDVESDLIGGHPTHLSIQADDKILAAGRESSITTRGTNDADGLVVARLLSSGAPDTGFGNGGFVLIELGQPGPAISTPGPVLEQRDHALVVPGSVPFWAPTSGARASVPPPAPGASYLALFRAIGENPAPAPQAPATPKVEAQVQAQTTPRSCTSRRALRIRLRTGRRAHEKSRIVSARVWVNGQRVKITRGNRVRARVDLRNLPKGRFSVKIRLRLADGGVVRETRRYRTCTKKIQRELKPLRTQAPKRS